MLKTRSQVYVSHVLEPTYNFTKDNFLNYILEINLVHVLMLFKQNIVPFDDAVKLLKSNAKLLNKGFQTAYDQKFEDLFFMLAEELKKEIDEEVVGNMHIAFSRNDMDATMFRMLWREKLVLWMEKIVELRHEILNIIQDNELTVMPAYTHNQQAQPTTLAHYLLAIDSHLQRDCQRGEALLKRVNCSPMGAAALGTTGFNIDRHYIKEKLGFDALIENSYDAIAASDYMLEMVSVLITSLSTISRFVYDLIILTTNEVQGLRLDDKLVQTSSIMPQKRNPSSLEHTKAYISRCIGELNGAFYLTHNVPFGDIVDIGDDIQPVLENGFDSTYKVMELIKEILSHSSFNKEILYERCRSGFSTVTELADTLVRECQLPFRQAHTIVSHYVDVLSKKGLGLPEGNAEMVKSIALEVTGSTVNLTEQHYQKAIDPLNFINVRDVIGGPSQKQVQSQKEGREADIKEYYTKILKWKGQFSHYSNKIIDEVNDVIGENG